MNKKKEKMLILDLSKYEYIPAIPCIYEYPGIKVFEFWNEQGKKINDLENISHDTKKIVIKTEKGIEPLKIPSNMQSHLLNYLQNKNQKEFKNITCHELIYYIVHGSHESIEDFFTHTIKKTKKFEIGDTALLGTFIKIFWKTITLDAEHSTIGIAKNEEMLFMSKLINKDKIIVTSLRELKKVYWASRSCAKTIWKT